MDNTEERLFEELSKGNPDLFWAITSPVCSKVAVRVGRVLQETRFDPATLEFRILGETVSKFALAEVRIVDVSVITVQGHHRQKSLMDAIRRKALDHDCVIGLDVVMVKKPGLGGLGYDPFDRYGECNALLQRRNKDSTEYFVCVQVEDLKRPDPYAFYVPIRPVAFSEKDQELLAERFEQARQNLSSE